MYRAPTIDPAFARDLKPHTTEQLSLQSASIAALLTYKMIFDIFKQYEKLTKKPVNSAFYGLPSNDSFRPMSPWQDNSRTGLSMT